MNALRPRTWFLAVACTAILAPAALAVPIVINYTNAAGQGFLDPTLGPARRACIEAAAANWAARIVGTVPIQVSAEMVSMASSAGSITLGGARATYLVWNIDPSTPKDTFYTVAEANQIAGYDIVPGADDIVIQYNSDVDLPTSLLAPAHFNYATDGRLTVSGGYYNIDFYQTCLHELGHGLGFTSSINQDGSYGTPTYPYPTIYDTFLANGSTAGAARLTSLPQATRAAVLVGNSLYFAGANSRAAAGGVNPRIYAPTTYAGGSTRSHLNEATYTGTTTRANLNELMTPYLGPGVMHQPGPIVSGVFEDIGWGFTPYTMAEASRALKSYAGLLTTTEANVVRLHSQGLATYPGRISLADTIRVIRGATGLDTNPFILGTQ